MKKQDLMKNALCVACLFTTLAVSAEKETGEWAIQPKVGLNIASIQDEDADNRLGAAVGLEAQYRASKFFAPSFGIFYSMLGCRNTAYVNIGSMLFKAKEKVCLDYVSVPILANFYLYKGLSVKFGLQPAINVVDKYKITVDGDTESESLSELLGQDTHTVDLSVPVGLSYEYKNVILDVRYNIGLLEVSEDLVKRNRVWQIMLGYSF